MHTDPVALDLALLVCGFSRLVGVRIDAARTLPGRGRLGVILIG
jgi:hypothetical protein